MNQIEFGSVCSGIEAASVAWEPLGWRAAWLSEIEAFPSEVLKIRVPHAPNLGDMTTLPKRIASREVKAPDVLTGGTPCQAFSVAGRREGLADPRGNLSMTFVEIADAIDDVRSIDGLDGCIVVWENVPGVLSSRDNAFGCFLGALAGEGCELQPAGGRWTDAGCVYGPARAIAWRVIDAQFFGLAQRRRRVFVVASSRIGFDPARILFEFDGVRRDSAPSREAGKDVAAGTLRSSDGGSDVDHARAGHIRPWPADVACTLNAAFGEKQGLEDQHALNTANNGKGSSEDGTGRGVPTVATAMAVRRLTPRECERLQGFPDDWTLIPVKARKKITSDRFAYLRARYPGLTAENALLLARDGPRYKAIGNSWAVTCARWVGRRIQLFLDGDL